jgi:hypothetical protein
MLLGSDYTEGVAGIGVVNALEVVSAWPDGLAGLARFKQWMDSPDERILAAATAALRGSQAAPSNEQQTAAGARKHRKQKKAGSMGSAAGRGRGRGRGGRKGRGRKRAAQDSSSSSSDEEEAAAEAEAGSGPAAAAEAAGAGGAVSAQQQDGSVQQASQSDVQEVAMADTPAQRRFKSLHRGVVRSWNLPAQFPSSRVHDAYHTPLVDRNPAKFNFGRPNSGLLVQFCRWALTMVTYPGNAHTLVLALCRALSCQAPCI